MQKSKHQFGLEEEILSMIYKLIEKKTSQIFREPVDATLLPDYYEKIKNPIDISTIIRKLKDGKYLYASEVRDDLNAMMVNCRFYNARVDILRTAQKFEKSIETEWGNFEKEVRRKDIAIGDRLKITEETLKNFQIIEEKNTNKKPSNLQAVLGELEAGKKPVPEYRILPPIPPELIQSDKGQNQLPKQLNYNPSKYVTLKPQEKMKMLAFSINKEEVAQIFQQVSAKKLAKYKKILLKKVMWIQTKIIRKCLERKRFKKMSTPQFLSSYIESGEIASNLQLRKLQMYVKMVAYWIEEYPQILSYAMKNKFIDTCRSIKRSIFRVLRYRKVPRSTKIQLDLNFNEAEMMKEENPLQQESKEQLMGEEQSRRYDNEIKSFKRMLNKDQGETIKKYTKIMIKNENGEFTVFDWNLENNDKKKTSRNTSVSRTQQNTEETQRMEKQKRKRMEREQDEQFLQNFQQRSNVDIIQTYQDMLWIDWDQIKLKKNAKAIELDFSKMVAV